MVYIPLNQELTCLVKRLVQRQMRPLLLVSSELEKLSVGVGVGGGKRFRGKKESLHQLKDRDQLKSCLGPKLGQAIYASFWWWGVGDDHAMDVDAWEFPVWLNSCISISD